MKGQTKMNLPNFYTDDIIKRAIKFKNKGNKIYLYTKEEENNG